MKAIMDSGAITEVALGLGELNEQCAFTGGGVLHLYANDPAADRPRPTKDLDIVLEITTQGKLEEIRQLLRKKGFKQDFQSSVICRFIFKDIPVDVMSTEPVEWAPANPWFKEGFQNLIREKISDQLFINLFQFPYFLAAKFVAYHNRGKDPRTSQDFEDIIFLLDNRLDFPQEINSSREAVKYYLKTELENLTTPAFTEAIMGHLNPFYRKERFPVLLENIRKVVGAMEI